VGLVQKKWAEEVAASGKRNVPSEATTEGEDEMEHAPSLDVVVGRCPLVGPGGGGEGSMNECVERWEKVEGRAAVRSSAICLPPKIKRC